MIQNAFTTGQRHTPTLTLPRLRGSEWVGELFVSSQFNFPRLPIA